ncbi:hypothetical protein [Cereibacter johrii]|uniref:hypothetical protein n=1 Tax=Cereibacter johrii TaxID=445629 RepID=UPI00114D3C07|nr:hypothetical protein [Cereibacter johrii]
MMKKSAWNWKMGLTALLTLAFVLVWPPAGHGSASSDNRGVQAEIHGHRVDAEQNDPALYCNVTSDGDCAASAISCCMMAHCCPGISVEPQDLPVVVWDDGAIVPAVVLGKGSNPGVVLPPPRRVPVWLPMKLT